MMCTIFQFNIFCPLLQVLVKNEMVKEHFPEPWLLADIITLTLATECSGRGSTQSQ